MAASRPQSTSSTGGSSLEHAIIAASLVAGVPQSVAHAVAGKNTLLVQVLNAYDFSVIDLDIIIANSAVTLTSSTAINVSVRFVLY